MDDLTTDTAETHTAMTAADLTAILSELDPTTQVRISYNGWSEAALCAYNKDDKRWYTLLKP